METQTSLFGNLDTAHGALARGHKIVEKVLNDGKLRMRKQDINRARKYLKSIQKEVTRSKFVLKELEIFAS